MDMFNFDTPCLILDASSPWLHAGVMSNGKWLSLERAEGDAITLLPLLARNALARSGHKLAEMRALAFCEGPGALLGLRLAAMMIETWRAMPEMTGVPLYSYRSLAAAAAIIAAESNSAHFCVATPFRRGSYCVWNGTDTKLLDEDTFKALSETLYLVPQRHIKTTPENAVFLDYNLAKLPAILATNPNFLRLSDKAEVFTPVLSEYKVWNGARHRATTE